MRSLVRRVLVASPHYLAKCGAPTEAAHPHQHDLIVHPILNIYRKYYGPRMAGFLFVTFYTSMAAAGLLVELLFAALRLISSSAMRLSSRRLLSGTTRRGSTSPSLRSGRISSGTSSGRAAPRC